MAYAAPSGGKGAKMLAYMLGFASTAFGLVRKRRHFDLFHLTPLYRQFLFAEALICATAWLLGKRLVLDVRAGSFVTHYRERSVLYRALADALLGRAETVTIEGKDYLSLHADAAHGTDPLSAELCGKAAPVRTPISPERNGATMRLVFLSRVVPEKGVETAIGALEALLGMGVKASLQIIGGGDTTMLPHWQNARAICRSFGAARWRRARWWIISPPRISSFFQRSIAGRATQTLSPRLWQKGWCRSVLSSASTRAWWETRDTFCL